VYAGVNVIISAPGLYGYAAVIFNHEAFQSHMNALSKLVIFSSLIHQLAFTLFSGLPFAIGTVQDAGLIFLSAMANIIANEILNDDEDGEGGGTIEEVVSTTLVLLPLGTALLGVVLMVMGKFRLADAVSYLPMPVVGGYLAFIGYFCLEAGVALCISEAMVGLKDWAYLLQWEKFVLAVPGLAAGLLLTWISRTATNDIYLPLSMVIIPACFYLIIYVSGCGLEGARESGWVGEVAPPGTNQTNNGPNIKWLTYNHELFPIVLTYIFLTIFRFRPLHSCGNMCVCICCANVCYIFIVGQFQFRICFSWLISNWYDGIWHPNALRRGQEWSLWLVLPLVWTWRPLVWIWVKHWIPTKNS
jgi:hypothetical protein